MKVILLSTEAQTGLLLQYSEKYKWDMNSSFKEPNHHLLILLVNKQIS